MNDFLKLSLRRLVAIVIVILLFFLIVDGAIPQLQMFFLRGNILAGNFVFKAAVLAIALLGFLVYPRIRVVGLPILTWLLCIGYLILEIPYLNRAHRMPIGDVLQSYNAYYLLLLIGPVLVPFRGAVSERIITRCTVYSFLVCAAIGIAQYSAAQPLLPTDSADGAFQVNSWIFVGQIRAFSLFTSSMNFGMFCALCGALGIALLRRMPVRGILLFIVSGVACFSTLTRLCYLVFVCTCFYALVLTFGKRPARGLWYPVLFFVIGISTILIGLRSSNSDTGDLQDTASLIQRITQWTYYSELILQSSPPEKVFGAGIVQNEKLLSLYPMIIDNTPLALVLHIGVVGLVLFGVLMIKMWLYLRRKALATEQPFLIAAASFWATLACAGIFNIVFSSFGAVFALAILCEKDLSTQRRHKSIGGFVGKRRGLRPELAGSLKESRVFVDPIPPPG